MNLNHARLPIPPFPRNVDGGGFEPPKSVTADLQSAPFGHSGTYPCISVVRIRPGRVEEQLRRSTGLAPFG